MITKEEVLKIAKLSKLTLNENEIELFSNQIGGIIKYVEMLNELDTEGVEPSAKATDSVNVFREDVIQKGLDINDVLLNAPQKENNMFKVPKI